MTDNTLTYWLRIHCYNLFSGSRHFQIFYSLLLIAMATLPFTTWFMVPVGIGMALNWIIEWNWREKWQTLRNQKALPMLLVGVLPFFILIPGLITSCNKGAAIAAFDCNLWMLIAPVILLTQKESEFTRRHLHAAFGLFSIVLTLHIIILILIATVSFLQTKSAYHFYYSRLSRFVHPSYLAMYATFSFFFLLQHLMKKWKQLTILQRVTFILTLTVSSLAVILLQSKAGLLCFLCISVIWNLQYMYNKKRVVTGLLIFIVLGSGSTLIYKSGWLEKNRLMESIEQMKKYKENPYGTGSSEIRLTLWKTTSELIRENMPWGVGTGDGEQEIQLRALEKNYTNLIGHHYNAHNQYLQVLLESGIPGLIVLLCFCLYPFFYSIRKKHFLYYAFLLLLILNIAVECMFKVRAGVDFFALFNILLFIDCKTA